MALYEMRHEMHTGDQRALAACATGYYEQCTWLSAMLPSVCPMYPSEAPDVILRTLPRHPVLSATVSAIAALFIDSPQHSTRTLMTLDDLNPRKDNAETGATGAMDAQIETLKGAAFELLQKLMENKNVREGLVPLLSAFTARSSRRLESGDDTLRTTLAHYIPEMSAADSDEFINAIHGLRDYGRRLGMKIYSLLSISDQLLAIRSTRDADDATLFLAHVKASAVTQRVLGLMRPSDADRVVLEQYITMRASPPQVGAAVEVVLSNVPMDAITSQQRRVLHATIARFHPVGRFVAALLIRIPR